VTGDLDLPGVASAADDIDVVKRFFDRANALDWEGMKDVVTDDFEFQTPPDGLHGAMTFRGLDDWVKRFWGQEADSWDLERSSDEIVEARPLRPGLVVVHSRGKDVGRASGVPVESRRGMVFEVREARVSVVRLYMTFETALHRAPLADRR
jgi:ketosteroid isomerase-like protein